jgi:type II secretion system protein H
MNRCSRKTSRCSAGFTLIEILCVVVILGIASAVIIPQIGSRDDLRAAAAARTVMSDLIWAQNSAIAQQRRYYVQFGGQQYTVLSRAADVDPLVTATHPITKNSYIVPFDTRTNGTDGVTLGTPNFGVAGVTIIGFDDLGSPFAYDVGTNTSTPLTAAGTIPVICGGQTLTISVEPYTGEAMVN